MSPEPDATGSRRQAGAAPPACCPFYHEAVELIGRRWTGAIVAVLLDHGPMRFSEMAQSVPELSDRLLSERMKELEARGVVERHVEPGPPVRVTYALTPMGAELQPALQELKSWARQWLAQEKQSTRRRRVRTF
jgi:DNA-binding HxlR family transcriptional regulator